MKKLILIILVFIHQIEAQNTFNKDSIIASIESRISLPNIPKYVVHVTQFGAKGDGVKDCKKAFDKAMDACAKKNGGTIVVPKGTYKINGPIHFKSYVNLHLEVGATLVFGDNPIDYPNVSTSWEGTAVYNHSPMIYGINVQDVAITGKGTIDGQGHKNWATWKPLEKKGQLLSREMNHQQVPVKNRVFGEGYYLRPQLIQFVNSKNILIEDVKVEDAPFWCVHLLKSKSITLRGIRYDAHNKNNDGLDIEQSSDVLIENIAFNTADDNIAIKAGRDDDGRNSNLPSENIVVRNCKFKGLHALVIGSEMSAGVKNVYVFDSEASGYLKRGIYVKTNSDRGGYVKNIHIENIAFGDVEDAIYMTSNYHGEGSGKYPSKISDISIRNVSFNAVSNTAIVIEGYPGFQVENVIIDHVNITSAKNGLTLTNTKNVQFNEVVIGEKQSIPTAVH
ncbi:glycoside hydrolase family 28 protein [Mariniflexile litorale]|uniref:Glycoside hydrolase family 28 protein n=1 Tax=Mariniflexile litorale TaxID=3045158 RepID=A0AAU7ELJ5_9FLAO|nr:glycoside hydrolase family 28 protein [Mariniflexile sp. KMM 9835]MDQ8210591.1 glycoside hydrolase family 28 protein [Mariniflexile sp. KMM 9835]